MLTPAEQYVCTQWFICLWIGLNNEDVCLVTKAKFTVYRHKVFDFVCGRAVIIQISDWLNNLNVYPRAHNYIDHALQLERLRSRSGGELQATEYLLYCIWNLKIFEKFWKSMLVVTINCEFSLPLLRYTCSSFHVCKSNWEISTIRYIPV